MPTSTEPPLELLAPFLSDALAHARELENCAAALASGSAEGATRRAADCAHALQGDARYLRETPLAESAAELQRLVRAEAAPAIVLAALEGLRATLNDTVGRLSARAAPAQRAPARRAIVLDDSATWREAAQLVLARAGFAALALERPADIDPELGPYALILWDASLLGAGDVAAMRSRLAPSAPRIVIYSAQSATDLAELARTHGADGFLEKTADGERLFAHLSEFLPQAASDEATSDDEGTVDVLVFEIERWLCGLPTRSIQELVRAVAIEELPDAPPVVEGLINVRGHVVPVLDLRNRFKLKRRPLSASEHFLLVRARQKTVALRTDRARDVISLDASRLRELASLAQGFGYLARVAPLPEGLLVIHDVDSFLSAEEAIGIEELINRVTDSSWS